jgi:cell wall-associated NlpC family hydrolase
MLSGPSVEIDPRVNAVRGDLADIALAGQLFAPHYAEPVQMACMVDHTPLMHSPGGEQGSELLMGETFHVLDTSGGWSWGYCAHDHYVGYVRSEALGPLHASEAPSAQADSVTTAEGFIDLPYVWGGRGGEGIDCSGLVQRSLSAARIVAPRDSDQQMSSLGSEVPEGEPLQRGDIIFFSGHVGMMHDATNLLHATRHHGKVVIEPLSEVDARFKERNNGVGIIARRRISA